jgi:hypothetical protein
MKRSGKAANRGSWLSTYVPWFAVGLALFGYSLISLVASDVRVRDIRAAELFGGLALLFGYAALSLPGAQVLRSKPADNKLRLRFTQAAAGFALLHMALEMSQLEWSAGFGVLSGRFKAGMTAGLLATAILLGAAVSNLWLAKVPDRIRRWAFVSAYVAAAAALLHIWLIEPFVSTWWAVPALLLIVCDIIALEMVRVSRLQMKNKPSGDTLGPKIAAAAGVIVLGLIIAAGYLLPSQAREHAAHVPEEPGVHIHAH